MNCAYLSPGYLIGIGVECREYGRLTRANLKLKQWKQ